MPVHHRTALYLRISTADQKPDLQFDNLRAYAARTHLTIVRAFASEQAARRPERGRRAADDVSNVPRLARLSFPCPSSRS